MKTLIIIVFIMGFFIGSCGRAESDNTRAELVMAPVAGYRCFVIKNNDGQAVGGNCVREN